jgi:hypothetical protein
LAVQTIVGLIRHQELGAVRGSEDNRAGLTKTLGGLGIAVWATAFIQETAGLAQVTCDGNRTLDGERKTVQWAARSRRAIQRDGLLSNPVGIKVNKGMQAGVELFDALDVQLGKLEC